MAYYPLATEFGAIYSLVNGQFSAVFNDPSDANYVGMLSEVTGLDSADVRENATDLVESDGGVHGNFYLGRRPIVMTGRVFGHTTLAQRAARLDKARAASMALRSDATLSWNPSANQFRSAMVTSAPALWWRLSDTSGTTAADSSGNARNGTYTGGVTLNQAGFGPDGSASVLLDGTNGRVTSTYNPFAQNTVRTYSGWAQRRTSVNNHSLFGGDTGTGPTLRLQAGSTDVRFSPDATNVGGQIWTAAAPAVGQWFHWALTYDDTAAARTAVLYINGVSQGSKTPAGGYHATPGNFEAGARAGATEPFDGYNEDVAVWTRALSAAEIANLYAQGGVNVPRLWVPVRRQQPFRESGAWVKEFQIPLVSQYAQIFNWNLKTSATTAAGTGIPLENIGNWPSYPILRITGVSGNTTTVTDGHGGTFKTLSALSLAAGEVVEFDMLNHSGVFTVGARAGQSATRYIDYTSITQWPYVASGTGNTFTLAVGASGTLAVVYRDTWA